MLSAEGVLPGYLDDFLENVPERRVCREAIEIYSIEHRQLV